MENKKLFIWITLYFFGIIGFIDYHYDSINKFLKAQSLQNRYVQYDDLQFRMIRRSTTTIDTTTPITCQYDEECENGVCYHSDMTNESYCECDAGWKSLDDNGDPSEFPCSYEQLSWLAALLISIFVGGCGIDWCFLSRGNGCYICLGILKGLTVGGLAIWWLADIIRLGLNDFPDGNGVELNDS